MVPVLVGGIVAVVEAVAVGGTAVFVRVAEATGGTLVIVLVGETGELV